MNLSTDYYPFGSPISSRKWQASSSYRYGFNGQEKDDEIFEGAYASTYWQYDSRLGRRWNIDPVVKPWQSGYSTFANSPIVLIDPDGADEKNQQQANKKDAKDGDTYVDKKGSSFSYNAGLKEWLPTEPGQMTNGSSDSPPLQAIATNNANNSRTSNPKVSESSASPSVPNWLGNTIGTAGVTSDIASRYIPLEKLWGLQESGRFQMKVNGEIRIMKDAFQGSQSISNATVNEAKAAFAAKVTTQIKVLNVIKIVGNVANVANLGVVGYKMVVLKDKSPRNKYDLVMGGVAFIPVVGWAASGIYFVGSTIIGDENMNKGLEIGEKSVSQGWEAVHEYNQSTDATTHVVCFTKGTLISTPVGFIEIEKINTGQNVYSYNLKNDSIEIDTVVQIINRYSDHIYKIKTTFETIEVTSEHPFYVISKGWVKAKELQRGYLLKTDSGSEVQVTDINYTLAEIMVYNIEVTKNSNYFVTKSKVLVHNKKINKKITKK